MTRKELNDFIESLIASKVEINSITPDDVSKCILFCADYFDTNRISELKPDNFKDLFVTADNTDIVVSAKKGGFIYLNKSGSYNINLSEYDNVIDTIEVAQGETKLLSWDGLVIRQYTLNTLANEYETGASRDKAVSQYAVNKLYKTVQNFVTLADVEKLLLGYLKRETNGDIEVSAISDNIFVRAYDEKERTVVKIPVTLLKGIKGDKGDKGEQGNSGYTGKLDELEIVNNLVSDNQTAALSAFQGKVLNEKIEQKADTKTVTQIESKVEDIDSELKRLILNSGVSELEVRYNNGSASYFDNGGRVVLQNEGDFVELEVKYLSQGEDLLANANLFSINVLNSAIGGVNNSNQFVFKAISVDTYHQWDLGAEVNPLEYNTYRIQLAVSDGKKGWKLFVNGEDKGFREINLETEKAEASFNRFVYINSADTSISVKRVSYKTEFEEKTLFVNDLMSIAVGNILMISDYSDITKELAVLKERVSLLESGAVKNIEDIEKVRNLALSGWQYAGVAIVQTKPNIYEGSKVFYVAGEAGVYVNFDNIEVNSGELAILKNNDGVWVKDVWNTLEYEKLKEVEEFNKKVYSYSNYIVQTTGSDNGVILVGDLYLKNAGDFIELELSDLSNGDGEGLLIGEELSAGINKSTKEFTVSNLGTSVSWNIGEVDPEQVNKYKLIMTDESNAELFVNDLSLGVKTTKMMNVKKVAYCSNTEKSFAVKSIRVYTLGGGERAFSAYDMISSSNGSIKVYPFEYTKVFIN